MRKYRWIMYLYTPLNSFDVQRVTSLEEARSALVEYGRVTGFHQNLTVNGDYGPTAVLYPYSPESWVQAEYFREVGNPLDYPSKLVASGPRGGVRITNA